MPLDHRVPETRSGWRRSLAILVALVVGVSGSLALAASPTQADPAPVWEPQITVSKTIGLDGAGEVVTITGSGFDPEANVGTRPPLLNQKTGVYVVFGRFGDPWRPSASAPSSSRSVIAQRWVLPAASRAIVDPDSTNDAYVTMNEDGTFETTLTLSVDDTKTGAYGVATYAAGGAVNASQELMVPVSFPKITVSKTVGIDRAGEVVTITGSGFDPRANLGTRPPLSGQETGVYAVFGRFGDPWRPSASAPSSSRSVIAQRWVLPAASRAIVDPDGTNDAYVTMNEDGTFETTLTLTMDDTKTGTYGVATYGAGGAVNAADELLTPVTFDLVDVPKDDIFYGDVMWAASEGITEGFEDGTFGPTLATTRQTAAAFLYRLAGSPPVEPGAPVFSDVPEDSLFHDAISWMAAQGITEGFGDGTFRPTEVLSRQTMAVFLYRAAGSPVVEPGGPTFSDVPDAGLFHDAISWLAAHEIAEGFPDGTFRPADVVSRQTMVAFLHRYAQLS